MTEKKEILPLTEEEIDLKVEEVFAGDSAGFEMGAVWAKKSSDKYWKQKLLEEVEKAFKAGSNVALNEYEGEYVDPVREKEEYMEQLKNTL